MKIEKCAVNILPHGSLPDVSVVMAVHKEVAYTHFIQAINSIIEQTQLNYEFIIVCDGDLTSEQDNYLLSIQKKYFFVSVIRLNKNKGPGAARNIGICNAKGKYIAIMDSDDIASLNRLKRQFEYLEAHDDIAVVGGSCEVIDDDGVVTGVRTLPLLPKSIRLYSLFFSPLSNPTVMGRRNILQNYMYDEKLRKGEDYRLWIKILRANYNIANINDVLIKYRVNDDLYKRRSGFSAGIPDFINRMYAIQLSPIYLVPFVLLFAMGTFGVRLLPINVIQFLTTRLEAIRARLIN